MIRRRDRREGRDWTSMVVLGCLLVYVGFVLFMVYEAVSVR